jgi:thiamine biosynthesis lipoprotein
LGTLVAIEARAADPAIAELAVSAGFDAISALDAQLHPTRPGSDLARLNRAGPGQRLPVRASTLAVLRLSRDLCALSGGLFDPALPGRGSIMHWQPAGRGAVRVQRRAFVDLGGIAKGYAVDLAVAALWRAGAHGGLVNAGGDLRAFGAEPWPVALRLAGTTTRTLEIRELALAVSDPAATAWPAEHQGYYRGGGARGGRGPRAAAIIAPSAALADALTKVLMYASAARGARVLARCGAHSLACGP